MIPLLLAACISPPGPLEEYATQLGVRFGEHLLEVSAPQQNGASYYLYANYMAGSWTILQVSELEIACIVKVGVKPGKAT